MGAARLPDPVAGGSDRRPRALPQALHGEPSKGRRKRSDRAFPAAGPSRMHPALRGAHRGNRRNACAGPRKAQLRVVTLAPDGALLLRKSRALARRAGSTAEKDALHVQAALLPTAEKGLGADERLQKARTAGARATLCTAGGVSRRASGSPRRHDVATNGFWKPANRRRETRAKVIALWALTKREQSGFRTENCGQSTFYSGYAPQKQAK